MAPRCGSRVLLYNISPELDGKEAVVIDIDDQGVVVVQGVIEDDGVGEQRLATANIRLSRFMGQMLDGTHPLANDFIHTFADFCGLKLYSSAAPVCKALAAESAAWPLVRVVGRPFGRPFAMTRDEEVICQPQFCWVGRPAVLPRAWVGYDFLCFPETRIVHDNDPNVEHADPGENGQPRVGWLNCCTPTNEDLAFVARRGVLSTPTAVAATEDLRSLFVADVGRTLDKSEIVDGAWQFLHTTDPPAKIVKLSFDSIRSLMDGRFTSQAFGEDLVQPVDVAVSSAVHNVVFVLNCPRTPYGQPAPGLVVAKFDASSLECTGRFGGDVLTEPLAIAVQGSELFVTEASRIVSFSYDGGVLRTLVPDYLSHIRSISVFREHVVVMGSGRVLVPACDHDNTRDNSGRVGLMEVMTLQGSTRQVLRFPSVDALKTACATASHFYAVTDVEHYGECHESVFVLESLH